jgi:hypothetical protein
MLVHLCVHPWSSAVARVLAPSAQQTKGGAQQTAFLLKLLFFVMSVGEPTATKERGTISATTSANVIRL